MSIMRKYISPALFYAAVFLFSFVPYEAFSLAVGVIYTYLTYELPGIVPDYSAVLHPEEYARLEATMDWIALSLTVITVTYIAMKLDNARFEYTVKPSGGLYRIPDAWIKYTREFTVSDLISATLIPALFIGAAYFLPKEAMQWGGSIVFYVGASISSHADAFRAILYSVGISVLARAVFTPKLLIEWRAAWLTASMG